MTPSRLYTRKQERIMVKSFGVNFSLVVIKIISGFLFRSSALIADGIHSLSDLLSDVFVIFGIRHSAKPADEEHPFGHGKFEYVLSIFLGVSILFVAYQLVRPVVMNFHTVPTVPRLYGLVVVVFVIVTKMLLSRYLIDRGKHLESSVILASGKESLMDVVSSTVVFVGILAAVVGDYLGITWFVYGDRIASLIIALFIIKVAIEILVDAIQSILGKSAKTEILDETKARALAIKGVQAVDNLTMIVYGHYYQVMIDIRVNGSMTVTEGHDIASDVKEALLEDKKIVHVLVHVNPEGE